jgi:hypothetical protein
MVLILTVHFRLVALDFMVVTQPASATMPVADRTSAPRRDTLPHAARSGFQAFPQS